MSDFRSKPSAWLMYNSSGFPDFLFTILTWSMILPTSRQTAFLSSRGSCSQLFSKPA